MGVLRWTGPGSSSHVQVVLPENKSYCMDVVLADWFDDALIGGLVITVDDDPVATEVVQLEGETRIRVSLRALGSPVRIGLTLPYTGIKEDRNASAIDHSHARRQGLAVYRFEFTQL